MSKMEEKKKKKERTEEAGRPKINLNCRFYKNKLPEQGDLVLVLVNKVTEVGAYVNLLEYNNIEGMIALTEASKRRIRSVNKILRIGR